MKYESTDGSYYSKTNNIATGICLALKIELNALRQRQFGTIINGIGLSSHVGLPGI